MPAFRNASGLTPYALYCGYLQQAVLSNDLHDVKVWLEQDGACFHVRAHDYLDKGRLHWDSFPASELTQARKRWSEMVREVMGPQLADIRKDKRYRVAREFTGDAEPWYVVRFCGEIVAKTDTQQGAWAKAYDYQRDRLPKVRKKFEVVDSHKMLITPQPSQKNRWMVLCSGPDLPGQVLEGSFPNRRAAERYVKQNAARA